VPGVDYPLKPGVNTFGRAEGNDHVIPDGSVSSRHCEIMLEGDNLILKDLGSTNGTTVEQQRVTQAIIQPGQTFRLGNAEFLFLDDQPAPAAAPPSPPPVPAPIPQPSIRISVPTPGVSIAVAAPAQAAISAGPHCFQHVASPADFSCTKCGNDLCPQCVRMQKLGSKFVPFCTTCGGKCIPLAQKSAAIPKKTATFFGSLGSAFIYPFKGNGLLILLCGTFFFGILEFLSSFVFLMALMLKVITYGYLFAYMQKIISSSADGEEEPPGFPDVTDMGSDIIQPFLLLIGTFAVSFGPAFFLYAQGAIMAGNLMLLLGMVYFPMALLGVAMADSMSGLNPLLVTSTILKVPGPYLIAVIVLGILVAVRMIIPVVLDMIPIPLVGWTMISFTTLLLLTIEMRILGVLYYTNRKKIGWY
jgi:hypothetical protein